VNDPQSASTGYLQLYLRRSVEFVYPGGAEAAYRSGLLLIVSGTNMDVLNEDCAKAGLRARVLDSWISPHTNPLPEATRAAFETGSLAPLLVRHSLVSLERP
jgi:hypothetical protein